MFWIWFFRISDFLCRFIPNRARRDYVRRVKLFDWRRKYNALRDAFPELNFRHAKMVKGGWNIGFIIDNKYVFKVRKQPDTPVSHEKLLLQQRVTAALKSFSPLKMLDIQIFDVDEYTFYRYPFIRGHNLNHFHSSTIRRHRDLWGHQIADFIYKIHHANPKEIKDLITPEGDGWNHNDLCNNVLVDTKTMRVVGVIDWEYAGWGYLETEFRNCTRFSSAMRKSGIGDVIRAEYEKIAK